jgi:predicted Zn finger-like uncharacterized protein
MPIRITCPSCSTTLSVKDEFADRAVKCPKCGGIIPAAQLADAQPADAQPAETPAASPAPFEGQDEPAKPAARATAKPVPKAAAEPADEDDPPSRSARRGNRDDRDDRDRPGKGRRRRDEDDPPGRPRKSAGGSNTGLILGIVGMVLLTCCGGGIGLTWYLMKKAQEVVEAGKEQMDHMVDTLKKSNPHVTLQSLGAGTVAGTDDLQLAFPNAADQQKAAWAEKVAEGRAVVWRNGDDFLLAAFHPGAEAAGRLQMKEWRPKNGANARAGEMDDAAFLKKFSPLSPTAEVRAEDIAKELKDDRKMARGKYEKKTFVVTGKLIDIDLDENNLRVWLEGIPKAPGQGELHMICTLRPGQSPFGYSRGQRIKVSGNCDEASWSHPIFTNCTISGSEPNPAVLVTASTLIADYGDERAADAKYRGKELIVTEALVESIQPDGDGVILVPIGKPGAAGWKILVEYDTKFKNRLPVLRVGATVKIRGTCAGLSGPKEINIAPSAWFSP